jgi:hypothetical protein
MSQARIAEQRGNAGLTDRLFDTKLDISTIGATAER